MLVRAPAPLEDTLLTKNLAKENSFIRTTKPAATRTNWMFEVEPYSRIQGDSLQDLRDNLRLKKALKHAVKRDFAPATLIESIRTGIRA